MALDPFSDRTDAVSSPARRMLAITPSDATDLVEVPKAIFVGAAGNVALIAAGDTVAVTLLGLAPGSILPVRAKRVMSTGTTATGLVALY